MDRKLVKQTVMTSVYGVTYVGAREQIKRRLKERGAIADDAELFSASCYAAKVIFFLCQSVDFSFELFIPVVFYLIVDIPLYSVVVYSTICWYCCF